MSRRGDMRDDARGRVVAVVLCAGQGTRMGARQNKVFLPVAGRPVVAWAVGAFERAPVVDEILLVAHPDEVGRVREEIVAREGFRKVAGVIAGGATRHQSERNALEALRAGIESGAVGLVMIHDGARPLVTVEEIERLARAARELPEPGGALLATPVAADEVIAQVEAGGALLRVYDAGELARAQTPQGFDARLLLAAYDEAQAAGFEGTDTASTVEQLGAPVVIVPGDEANLKVTTPDDLLRAEAILRARGQA